MVITIFLTKWGFSFNFVHAEVGIIKRKQSKTTTLSDLNTTAIVGFSMYRSVHAEVGIIK